MLLYACCLPASRPTLLLYACCLPHDLPRHATEDSVREQIRFSEVARRLKLNRRYIEDKVGCPIKYVSVGAERDAYIYRP